jgi:Pyrimidine 5'-nucleotidase (UMPH-1)
MVEDSDGRTVLRVGLCNDKKDERLPTYSEAFDIVITDDDGFSELLTHINPAH